LQALVGKAGESIKAANELPPQMVAELVSALASMVKGGQQATDSDIRHFMVNNIGMDKAKVQQYLTNGVKGAGAGEFVQLYLKAAKRERGELQSQNDETVLKKAQGNLKLYKVLDDDDKEIWKNTVADRMNVSPEDIIIDEKKGSITTKQRQAHDSDHKMAVDNLKKAYVTLKKKSAAPEELERAQKVLKSLGVQPGTPMKQAEEDIRYKITRGLL
jgi:DNA-binding phage protein